MGLDASRDLQTLTNLQASLRGYKRQSKSAYALRLHFSKLERIYQSGSYKRASAASLQPLIRSYQAETFLLSSGDMILLVGSITPDVIEKALVQVRADLSGSEVIGGLSGEAGVSDAFTSWYALETDLSRFEGLVFELKQAAAPNPETAADQPGRLPDPRGQEAAQPSIKAAEGPAPVRGGAPEGRVIKRVEFPSMEADQVHKGPSRLMDFEMFNAVVMNLLSMNLSDLMQRENVVALVPGVPAAAVMTHRFVSFERVMERSFGDQTIEVDPWFRGYIQDLIADRFIASLDGLPTEQSIASSLRVTTRVVLSPTFERFNRALGDVPRKRIILEFSIVDAVANTDAFIQATDRVRAEGFRVQISDMNTRAFMWLQAKSMEVSFVKLSASQAAYEDWLSPTRPPATDLRKAIQAFGAERVIIGNCTRLAYAEAAQKLGVFLFAGPAIDETMVKDSA